MKTLTKLTEKLYSYRGDKITMLVWVFIFISFVWGASFVVFPHSPGVNNTQIFSLTMQYLPSWFGNLWGWGLLITSVGTSVSFFIKKGRYVQYFALLGFACWMYALGLYGIERMFFTAETVAIPNLVFWAYLYIKTSRLIKTRGKVPLHLDREDLDVLD